MPKSMLSRIPSYRKHKPTGQAVVTLSGKDYYLGCYGTAASKAEYECRVAEWLARGRQLPQANSGLMVSELLLAFLRHAQKHYRRPHCSRGSMLRSQPRGYPLRLVQRRAQLHLIQRRAQLHLIRHGQHRL